MPNRYWVGGTGNWDSTTTANWSATSGGPSGASVPTAADDVFIDANSGAVTVTKTTSTSCLTLTFTGFTGTWSIANGITLTVVGTSITLGSGMTYTQGTTGVLSTISGNNLTITFAGITIPRLTVGTTVSGGGQTITISGTTPTVQNLVVNSPPGFASLSGQLNITNSLTNIAAGSLIGTAFNITGGGTVNISTTSTGGISGGFTVLSGTTLSMQSTLNILGGTITFNSGSFLTPNNNTLSITASTTLNTSLVEWWNVTYIGAFLGITYLSNLNIGNNFTISSSSQYTSTATGGTWNINIKGSLIFTTPILTTFTGLIINLIGTGTIEAISGALIGSATTININTSNLSGYTIGSSTASRNFLQLTGGVVFNLVGTTSSATVVSGHTLTVGTVTLSTNNTGSGGSQIIWQNLIFTLFSGNLTLNSDTTFLGNLSTTSSLIQVNGSKLLIGGNLTLPNSSTLSGTGTIEFTGSSNQNWNTAGFTCTYQNNITVNKSGGTLTLLGTINWGIAGRTLQRTLGNINGGTSTVTIPNVGVTISNMIFNNLTLTGGASTTITQNVANTINSILQLNGSTTFAGTAGWTCASLIMTAAGSFTITLRNGVTYTTTTAVQLTGATNTNRYTMISDNVSFRAIWTVENTATQAITYVNGTRIDSSLGATVWTLGIVSLVAPDTRNWNNGSQPSTVGYTFVN